MDLNYNARIGYARVIAGNEGLTLVEEESDQPRTDGTRIYVPKYNPAWSFTSKEAQLWWYKFLHEIFHNIYKEDFEVVKREKVDMRSMFGFVHNLNLDHNIERCGSTIHAGLKDIVLAGRNLFLEWQYGKRKEIKNTNDILDAAFAFDTLCRRTWNTWITCEQDVLDVLSEEGFEKLGILDQFKERWIAPKDSEEVYELTKEICEALGIEKTEAQEQSGKGEGEESSSDDSDGENKDGVSSVVDYMEMLEHTHEEHGTEPSGSGVKVDYSKWTHYLGYKSPGFKFIEPRGATHTSFINRVNEIHGGESLSKEISKHLLIKSKAKIQPGFKRGRLDTSRLWKPKVYGPCSEAGSKVFTQKTNSNILDSAVLLLVDQSGSMHGLKYQHAAKATALLVDTLSALRIPLEVQSFSDNGSVNANWIHKTFAAKKSGDDIVTSFSKCLYDMSSNADGESILNACANLLARKEKRKIMVVLSDGMPSTHLGSGDIYGYTKKVVAEIEDKSPIDIYGIGIMDSSVKNIYKHCSVIKDAGDIERALLTVLKEKILL